MAEKMADIDWKQYEHLLSPEIKDLIFMKTLVESFGTTPKWGVAGDVVKLKPNGVRSRYDRIGRTILAAVSKAANTTPPVELGPDGKPVKRGRGRPPKKANSIAAKMAALNPGGDRDDEELLESGNKKSKHLSSKRKRTEEENLDIDEDKDDGEESSTAKSGDTSDGEEKVGMIGNPNANLEVKVEIQDGITNVNADGEPILKIKSEPGVEEEEAEKEEEAEVYDITEHVFKLETE